MKKPAQLWGKLQGSKVVCNACARRCHIPEGEGGFCYIRRNIGGKLYLLNYGTISALQLDPIEKKPFYHFMPGSSVLGLGTSSCNFGCLFCQNHNISKDKEINGVEIAPGEAVSLAMKYSAEGIALTYNEPTIFIEYAIDVAKIAHKKGISTMFVSNGYLTKESIQLMKGNIDAVVVDFKGNGEKIFSNKFEAIADEKPIFEALLELKAAGIHLEITDLIIPKAGDSEDACRNLAGWVVRNLGPDIPMHFNRFHPDYKMMDYNATSFDTLKRHYDIAKDEGVNFAYIGNVPDTKYSNTYCPKCGSECIERDYMHVRKWNLALGNTCPSCGASIPITGKYTNKPQQEIVSLY